MNLVNVTEIRQKVGYRIRSLRLDRNIGQGELARAMGITQQYLSKLEKGDVPIRVEHLFAVAKGLRCEVAEVVDIKK